jgi:hypothetical protein
MARLNTRSFPCYCGSCLAERAVTSVLRSAAVKKVVPILSTRVEKVFLCLAAILNLRNARVLFISHWRMNTGSMLKIDSSNFVSGDVFNYVTN